MHEYASIIHTCQWHEQRDASAAAEGRPVDERVGLQENGDLRGLKQPQRQYLFASGSRASFHFQKKTMPKVPV